MSRFVFIKKFIVSFIKKIFIASFYLTIFYLFLSIPGYWNAFKKKDTLNVYTFSEFFTPQSIQEFEELTGVKVYVRYFETNDELWAKFKINEGEGYDVITPSDFMVENLIKDGLLRKLDYSNLPCIAQLDKKLLNKFYDTGNQYTLPLEWFIYGFVFDKKLIKHPLKNYSLDLIFKDPKQLALNKTTSDSYKICMIDDGREAVMLAAIYLFGKVKNITDDEYNKILKLLLLQKNWVECYTSYGLQYFLVANIVHLGLTSSSYMRKIMRTSNRFDFKFPKEGTILTIENLAIPIKSTKVDLAHKFINFMLSRKISSLNSSAYGHLPSNKESYQDIEESIRNNPNFCLSDEFFAKSHLVHNQLPLKKIEEIWLSVKFGK